MPLGHILAQQPPIASLRSMLETLTDVKCQLAVFEAQKRILDSRYRDDVLRQYIALVEREGGEVIEEILEEFYKLKNQVKLFEPDSQQESSVRYDLPNGESVIINENRSTLVTSGQTGHRTWESSLAFTDLVCQNPLQFNETKMFLELGCGTGLVSMAMGKLNLADLIIATDGSELVASRLDKSIALNGLEGKIETSVLDWTDLDSVRKMPKSATVFAGDILYGLDSLYPSVLDALEILEPRKLLLSIPIRKPSSYGYFKQLCTSRNIGVKVLKRYEARSAEESEFMFLVSIPPIPLEIIELTF